VLDAETNLEIKPEVKSPELSEVYSKAYKYALFLLGRREYTVKALNEKLIGKKYAQAIVEAVLNELQQLNYVSDQRYADIFVRDAIAKGRGENRIKQGLKQKGVEQSFIANSLDEYQDWQSVAERMLQAKFKRQLESFNDLEKEEQYKLKQKMLAKCQYQGFVFDVSKKAVEKILGDYS